MSKSAEQEAVELIRKALIHLGFNTGATLGTVDTPRRFAQYLQEYMQAFSVEEVLKNGFDCPTAQGAHGMVVQWNIPFRMCCEHHLLPAYGRAAVGYIPGSRVVGLSKLTRITQAFGTLRPSLQEVITQNITDALEQHLSARGVMAVIDCEHTCMSCRGVNAPGVITTTSVVKGIFRDVPAAREEFMSIIGFRRGV